MEKCIKLLKKNPRNRSQEDIENLVKATTKLEIFHSYDESDKKEVQEQCCKIMRLSQIPKESFIFVKGEFSFDMYIILEGQVQILDTSPEFPLIPHSKENEEYLPSSSLILSELNSLSEPPIEINRLETGEYFGNLSLLYNTPRNATVKTVTPVSLAIISNMHKSLVQKLTESRILELVNFLKSVEIFKNYTKVSLQKLFIFLREKEFRKGDKIYNEGDEANEIYIIRKGEVKMTKTHYINNSEVDPAPRYCSKGNLLKFKRGFRKRELGVVIKSTREIFGESEIFNEQKIRSESANCISQSVEVLIMSYEIFTNYIQSSDSKALIMEHNEIRKEWKSKRYKSLEIADTLLYNWTFTPASKFLKKPEASKQVPNATVQSKSISLFLKNAEKLKKLSTVKPLPPIVKNIMTSRSIELRKPKSEKRFFSTFQTEVFEEKKFSGLISLKNKYFS